MKYNMKDIRKSTTHPRLAEPYVVEVSILVCWSEETGWIPIVR